MTRKIEVTAEMIEAGVHAAALYSCEDSLADMVISIFEAMSQCARRSPHKAPH